MVRTFIKETAEIDVDGIATDGIQKNILPVSITEAYDKANHRHHSDGPDVVQARQEPILRIGKRGQEPIAEHRWETRK